MRLDDLAGIAKAIGASRVRRTDRIQSLWSGYGEIFRVDVEDLSFETAIVKSVTPPARSHEESQSRSHARKCRSYDVEMAWYRRFAEKCDSTCRVPKLLASESAKNEWTFVLEDLDAAGFAQRTRDPNPKQIEACLAWLAAFHARFLRVPPGELWKSGTYWHLATRPDELAAIDDDALRAAAPILDRKLSDAAFQTLVHGDAKPANFCFSQTGSEVAAVDFQYVGGGCGMKDVAYFLADDDLPADREVRHVDFYFSCLHSAVALRHSAIDIRALEQEWRALYVVAKVDFYRFLAGWSKAQWRNQSRAHGVTRDLLSTLEK